MYTVSPLCARPSEFGAMTIQPKVIVAENSCEDRRTSSLKRGHAYREIRCDSLDDVSHNRRVVYLCEGVITLSD